MTHTKPMADSEGTFENWRNAVNCQCPKCKKHNVLYREWESSDGAYEDYRYKCQTTGCGHSWWVDGTDS